MIHTVRMWWWTTEPSVYIKREWCIRDSYSMLWSCWWIPAWVYCCRQWECLAHWISLLFLWKVWVCITWWCAKPSHHNCSSRPLHPTTTTESRRFFLHIYQVSYNPMPHIHIMPVSLCMLCVYIQYYVLIQCSYNNINNSDPVAPVRLCLSCNQTYITVSWVTSPSNYSHLDNITIEGRCLNLTGWEEQVYT